MIKKIQIYYIIFFVTAFLSLSINSNSSENSSLISIGSKNAKITVKVFSSLTCPHCADFHKKIFYKLEKEFIKTDIVKFEHHGFPLDLAALNAEKILRCSDNIKKRLSFLNEIYEKQDTWAVGQDINSINSKLMKMAKNYDLNDDRIKSCLNNEKMEDKILNDRITSNKKYSITATPTILINEEKYEGEHNYETFRKAIKKLL
tara:strand:+ start:11306 stop:11914 length:609 start_codon:yes stop_codon:yes gene_type:complete